MEKQDEQLTGIGNSVRGLKHVSALIASELDEQAVWVLEGLIEGGLSGCLIEDWFDGLFWKNF